MVKISPVQKITALCKYLPEKDKFYADAFIIRRDFTSLRDLVDSALRKVEKNLTKENPKKKVVIKEEVNEEKRVDENFIQDKINARKSAKDNKDYQEADKIRDELLSLGIKLIDTKDGTIYEKI